MKKNRILYQPNIKAKIIGTILIVLGLFFIFIDSPIYIKFGASCILIGLIMIILISEKSVTKMISNSQIEGNTNSLKQIIDKLNLKGNAIFIPKSNILTEERIFIPILNSNTSIPNIDNDFVFSTGNDGGSLGLVLPPSGLQLLNEVEKEVSFEKLESNQIEEKLQSFIGKEILNSISFKKNQDSWKLEIGNPLHCTKNSKICKQYPCPSCSAVLLAITKTFNQKIRINDINNNGKKTTFYLSMEK